MCYRHGTMLLNTIMCDFVLKLTVLQYPEALHPLNDDYMYSLIIEKVLPACDCSCGSLIPAQSFLFFCW